VLLFYWNKTIKKEENMSFSNKNKKKVHLLVKVDKRKKFMFHSFKNKK
jgi:hypothetical protein